MVSKPCKFGCGKNVEWRGKTSEKGSTGFFESEDGTEHTYIRCQSLGGQFPDRPPSSSWTGTTKGGRMFEARESKEIIKQEIQRVDEIISKLDELIGLCRETLITAKNIYDAKTPVWEDLTDDEIKKTADTEKIDEPQSLRTSDKEDDYGF